jgi:hypothetical protein
MTNSDIQLFFFLLQKEIEESEKLLNGPIDDTIYKCDLAKRID